MCVNVIEPLETFYIFVKYEIIGEVMVLMVFPTNLPFAGSSIA